MRIYIVIVLSLLSGVLFAQQMPLGKWMQDKDHLPSFQYDGALPFQATMKDGNKARLPDDPWFLLGNYRFTLFTHVSGTYQLITGERAWGRVNQSDAPNYGINSAGIDLIDKSGKRYQNYSLTGMNSLLADPAKSDREFGCGFARYDYTMNELTCSRTLSVKPSMNPNEGTSAFLLQVTMTNKSSKTLTVVYSESVTARYETMEQQRTDVKHRKVKYINTVLRNDDDKIIKVDMKGVTDDPFLFPTSSSISPVDGYPPSFFMKILSSTGKDQLLNETQGDKEKLSAKVEVTLKPGETKNVDIIIGYAFDNRFSEINAMCNTLKASASHASMVSKKQQVKGGAFGYEWSKVLPSFASEKDPVMAREMVWNAYNIEAMATYSEFYKETQVPQGTIYDYDWGQHASARDHFQHALPLIYYNPKLAKSVLRYMMKRTTTWGEIRLIERGYGISDHYSYFTSDQQLFYFLLLSEYLRVTKDFDFLLEEVETYPVQNGVRINSISNIENCFRFLRDEVGVGNHGLIRLMNSDWNDAVFYILKQPYNRALYTGESHMNSAMAITIFENLLQSLKAVESDSKFTSHASRINSLVQGITYYRTNVYNAFMKDLGDRTFSRRMYFAGTTYGDDNMFLEPQGYMLQFSELDTSRKAALYDEIKKRLMEGEKLGAREQQTPEFEDNEFDKGSRENGGFWYALHSPVILGVAQFDKEEARHLLREMTFDNLSKHFPQYWTSYWSAADNLESSLIPGEGLPDQSFRYSDIPVYCAHAHAWPLYCYYRLNEK